MNLLKRLAVALGLVGLFFAPGDRLLLPQDVASAQGVPPLSGGKVPSDFDILVKGITAGTTQTQAGATLLTGTINSVDTANTSDGVRLPLCAGGSGPPKRIILVNTTANTIKVYGTNPDTINAVATATGITQATKVAAEYVCVSVASGVGSWYDIGQ